MFWVIQYNTIQYNKLIQYNMIIWYNTIQYNDNTTIQNSVSQGKTLRLIAILLIVIIAILLIVIIAILLIVIIAIILIVIIAIILIVIIAILLIVRIAMSAGAKLCFWIFRSSWLLRFFVGPPPPPPYKWPSLGGPLGQWASCYKWASLGQASDPMLRSLSLVLSSLSLLS